jgi:hypothetical protein
LILLLGLPLSACASYEMAAELDQARLERDQAKLEAEKARVEADKAMVEAEKMRMEAEKKLAAAENCETTAAAPPPPGPTKTTVVRGQFKFAGKPAVVSVHVAGMGIDETFQSNAKGQIAIELPVGHYQINLEAKGYRNKVLTVDIPEKAEGERYELKAKLQRKKK